MCSPMAIPLVIMGVSAVVGAYGQYRGGQAAKNAADYTAAVAKNNQKLAERSAQDAERRGAIAMQMENAKGRLLMGKQQAALAANGIDLGSETAVDIASSQAGFNTLDSLTTKSNYDRDAAGFRIQGMNYKAQADMSKLEGQNKQYMANLAAASSVLTGTSQVAGQWYSWSNPTATTGPSATTSSSSGMYNGGTSTSYWGMKGGGV